MVNKKQKIDKPIIEVTAVTVPAESREVISPVVQQAPNPAEQLAKILALQEERTAKLEQQLLATQRALNSVMQQKQEEQENKPPAKMDPMAIFKQIMDFINTPMIQKLSDKLLGSIGEEEKPAQAMPSEADIKAAHEMQAYRDGQMRKMDQWQERFMEATVKGLEVINKMKEKELDSDYSG